MKTGRGFVKFFVVFVVVFMVVASGCMGGTGEGTSTQQLGETSQTGGYETSTGVQTSGGSSLPSETGTGGIEGLYGLTHVEYSSDGTKWVSVWVDNAQWESSSPGFHFMTPESPWFYSSGHLFLFEYGGETLYEYAKENDETPQPWIIMKVPYEGIDFHRGGLRASIVVLDRNGKLHLLLYNTDKIEEWPSTGDLKTLYFPEVEKEFSWDVGGNHLVTGWDYDENYIYYVTWGGNRVWIVGFTNEEFTDLVEYNGKKPEPKVFTFDSSVKGVIIGDHGIYIWEGNRVHAFKLATPDSLEESATVEVPETDLYSQYFGEYDDVLCFYDGEKVNMFRFSDGQLQERETVTLPGYDYVRCDPKDFELIAFKGNRVDFYSYDSSIDVTEYEGTLSLPAEVKIGYAYISTEGDAYAHFWGTDGKYYMVNGELGEEGPAGTSTGTPSESETETQTPTQTSTSTTTPGGSGSGDILQNPFEVDGIDFTRGDYKYFGIKVVPREGYLMYFPYGDESYLYQLVGRYVFRIYPWPYDYWNGYSSEPELEVPTPDLLPEEPKVFYGVPNGDDYLLAGKDGKLHILVGYGDETEVNGITVDTFKTHIAYDFDADGVVIDKVYNEYIAWKGNILRVYAYTDDEHYAMWDEGDEIYVDPVEYEFPERIIEVNPYLDEDFLVVRTEGGLYLTTKPSSNYADDPYIYRIVEGYVDFVGAIHYWGIWDLIVYKDGTLYHLDVEYSPDEYRMELTVDAQIDIPDVIGLYGPDSQEPYFVVSTSDGRLLVYEYVWDDGKQGYVFKLAKSYDLGIPLVKFYADYRPEWDWIKVLGISEDGTFYNLEITGPNAG